MVAQMTLPRVLIIFFTGFFAFTHFTLARASEDQPFQPSDNVMAEVDQVLAKARAEGKLALIVMGGNWCHDSMGLYHHFQDPELAATLDKNYEKLLVDVGYLDHAMEVIRRFGQPVIYGTPTVLIIDPDTEELLNRESMHRLRDSANMEIDEARTYFANTTARSVAEIDLAPRDPKLMALYEEIDAFEDQQATRIYQGFAVIGPLLEKSENGNEPDNFREVWREFSKFRYQITDDLAGLRAEARRRVAAGEENIQLDFPVYPAFSWE